MATKKMTRKDALTVAIDCVKNGDDSEFTLSDLDAAVETLTAMLEQLSKPHKATVSKARLTNLNLAERVRDAMADKETFTTKDVVALGWPEIATSQKATAVLKVAVEIHYAIKQTDGKKITYKAVNN